MKIQLYKGKNSHGEIIEGFLMAYRERSLCIIPIKNGTDITTQGCNGYGVCPDAIYVTNVKKSRLIEFEI